MQFVIEQNKPKSGRYLGRLFFSASLRKEKHLADSIPTKIKHWIDEGKDPRSAHWQGGLEEILNILSPYMDAGKLIFVQPLGKEDLPVFNTALEVVDLSPNLNAVFLPPSIANKITPPESAPELERIEKGKPSYKILIARPGKDQRIICVEISEQAKKPGIDIFESGALLGTYDFDTQEECMAGLTKTIRAHIWEKGQWSQDDYKRYTINWFEKILALRKGTVCVEENCSFLHSPTLIKSDRVDALFVLIFEIMLKGLSDTDNQFRADILSIQQNQNKEARTTLLNELAEKHVLELLSLMRDFKIVKFDEFSNKENDQFKNEFARTILRIMGRIEKMELN